MTNYFLSSNKELGTWTLCRENDSSILVEDGHKKIAIFKSVAFLKKIATEQEPVSLKIKKKKDGQIQEERTYPSKADPKRTKG